MEMIQDIENKHFREIELLKTEHTCLMRGLDADLTQTMTEKFDLEQRLAALAQPECSYRSNVSQQTNHKLLRDNNDYLQQVIKQLDEELSDSRLNF